MTIDLQKRQNITSVYTIKEGEKLCQLSCIKVFSKFVRSVALWGVTPHVKSGEFLHAG